MGLAATPVRAGFILWDERVSKHLWGAGPVGSGSWSAGRFGWLLWALWAWGGGRIGHSIERKEGHLVDA